MRKIIVGLILGAALLSACGTAPQSAADTAQTAVGSSDVATAMPDVATAVNDAANTVATSMPAVETALPQAATAAATAVAEGNQALSAVVDDVTLKQGEALVLDATRSVGDITDFKWTIEKAPTGAEAVIGKTIGEDKAGNISLKPEDYTKFFPTAGPYTVRLTVVNAAGATSSDDFTVQVP